jgi:hypothetical protein
LEYFISIRQGFLPLRFGSYIFIKPCSPHRCAHQFGLDQDIQAPLLRPTSLAADLEGIGWCYTHLFQLGTGAHCKIVSTSRILTFPRHYQQWYYDVIRSYQSYTPLVVVRSTCPRDGQILLDGTISHDHCPFSDIVVEPVDFQGLDSRFSCTSIRTILIDMLHHHFRLSLLF